MSNLEIKALIAISIGLCFGYIKGGVFYICHVLNTVMKQQGNFLSLDNIWSDNIHKLA